MRERERRKEGTEDVGEPSSVIAAIGAVAATGGPFSPSLVRSFALSLLTLLLAGFFAAPAAQAQQVVPANDEAELVFAQAVQAFEDGDYGMAYRRFRLVYTRYELNRKTTAALLMAGKALYRQGEYERAAEVLNELVAVFPTSGYVGEARRVLGYARQHLGGEVPQTRLVDLGILLPVGGPDGALTQALFNGVRLAVDEFNAAHDAVKVQMHFRDSGNRAQTASAAVTALTAAGADAIIGPLFSEEARAAGAQAERAGVVLVAPLATDEEVSDGRRYVFQANPTFTMRGRLMARYAVDELGLARFGGAAEIDAYGERMAEGFQDEVLRLGAEMPFFRRLTAASEWERLGLVLGEAPDFEALYLPITGGRARTDIRTTLASLDSLGLAGRLRVLGSAEWQGLGALGADAARYAAVYTDDFHAGATDADEQAFVRRYRDLAGEAPSGQTERLAYTGYDVARYLLDVIEQNPERPLREALRDAPPYQGLGIRLDFRGGNVNEAMYFFQYQGREAVLVR